MWLLVTSMFWFALAAVFAALEVEIEGKCGWAEKLPTWYRTTGFAARLFGFFVGRKPLTGYHTAMFFLVLMFFHAGFFTGTAWSPVAELSILAIYFAWNVLWDFLWFLLNPHYTFSGFRRDNIWWHAKSRWIFGRFPSDYLVGVLISCACAWAAMWLTGDEELLLCHLKHLTFWAAALLALSWAYPLYRSLYARLRLKDDRDKAGIFHN